MRHIFLWVLTLLPLSTPVSATILPYRTRTRDFSSWTAATRGDTSTIGMAGATLAVPTSISAAEANPAGFAMLTGSVSAQINKVSLTDKRLQRTGESVDSSQWGLGVTPGLWGYSIAYYSPQTESGIYASPNTGDTVKTEVSIKELRLSVARAFFDNALAVGVGLELLKAVRELDDTGANSYAPSYQFGALYRLPKRILLGVSFVPQATIGPAGNPNPQSILPGFNRSVVRPLQVGWGVGWIPNRFFKIGASATYVARTENTALLADESVATGAKPTWVPRLGASYVVAEFSNFKVESAAGSYIEMTRLSGSSDRLHVTGGIEANPYFVNLGAGFDISKDYRNLIISVGIDIVRTARSFDIIPKDSVPPYNGSWPRMTDPSPEGLPGGLVANESHEFAQPTVEAVGKIVSDVPENIAKKVMGQPTTVEIHEAENSELEDQGDLRLSGKHKKKSKRASSSAKAKAQARAESQVKATRKATRMATEKTPSKVKPEAHESLPSPSPRPTASIAP